jgi:hypothetical protein
MTRLRCLGCQDDHHCRHTAFVPAGSILVLCRCLDCDPKPIQARLFSHAWSSTTSAVAPTAASPPLSLDPPKRRELDGIAAGQRAI